jgi:HEAT repeat protein
VWKRCLVGILIALPCLAVVMWVFPATVYVPQGIWRHESFFEGKPTSYWTRALNRERFMGHAPPDGDAGQTLRDGGAAAVPVLCEIAQNPDKKVRMEAFAALSYMGPDAKAAVPTLAAAVKKEEVSTCFLLASDALAHADPAAAAEALGAVVANKDKPAPRAWALTELGKLVPHGQEAVPVLNEILHDPNEDPVLRVQAIAVLAQLKQPPEPLVAALCDYLVAKKSAVGVQAVEVLSDMGPAAKPALPTLLKLLQDPSLPVTGKRWGPPHRVAVIRAVGSIGPEAGPAVPVLLANLKTTNFHIRNEVAFALAQIGGPAKETLAAKHADSWTTIAALAAHPQGNLATAPLVQVMVRTWIPSDGKSLEAVQAAVLRLDPDSEPPWGSGTR